MKRYLIERDIPNVGSLTHGQLKDLAGTSNNVFLATALSASERPVRCPITGYPCEGDLSHLCEDYGCARKGGLSPRFE